MPRVTQRYSDARRQQVLWAAHRCFARRGFAGTSMAQVCAEASMSPGAVYGYFASKDQLVAAILDQVLDQVAAAFDNALEHPNPPSLAEVIATMFATLADPDQGPEPRLAVQVWAESLTNPTLANHLARAYRTQRHRLATVLARHHQRHQQPAHPDTLADMAIVLAALGPAFLLQRALFPELTADSFATGLRELLQLGATTPSPLLSGTNE